MEANKITAVPRRREFVRTLDQLAKVHNHVGTEVFKRTKVNSVCQTAIPGQAIEFKGERWIVKSSSSGIATCVCLAAAAAADLVRIPERDALCSPGLLSIGPFRQPMETANAVTVAGTIFFTDERPIVHVDEMRRLLAGTNTSLAHMLYDPCLRRRELSWDHVLYRCRTLSSWESLKSKMSICADRAVWIDLPGAMCMYCPFTGAVCRKSSAYGKMGCILMDRPSSDPIRTMNRCIGRFIKGQKRVLVMTQSTSLPWDQDAVLSTYDTDRHDEEQWDLVVADCPGSEQSVVRMNKLKFDRLLVYTPYMDQGLARRVVGMFGLDCEGLALEHAVKNLVVRDSCLPPYLTVRKVEPSPVEVKYAAYIKGQNVFFDTPRVFAKAISDGVIQDVSDLLKLMPVCPGPGESPLDVCAICTDVTGPSHVRIGGCNHAFHLNCLLKWLKTSRICPVDRTPVRLEEITSSSGVSQKARTALGTEARKHAKVVIATRSTIQSMCSDRRPLDFDTIVCVGTSPETDVDGLLALTTSARVDIYVQG